MMPAPIQLYALLFLLLVSMLNLFVMLKRRRSFRAVNSFKTHFYILIFLYLVAKAVQLYPLPGAYSISLFGITLLPNAIFQDLIQLFYFMLSLEFLFLVLFNALGAGFILSSYDGIKAVRLDSVQPLKMREIPRSERKENENKNSREKRGI
ncbi:MAG: hypothetical protein WC602_05215 [archaeon]